ncbi:phage tail tape measure protein [Erwinia psidii]|uniref:phage tail tape measure protein n=1 Tax=Erwinia psidii TaxID=69224 RepID=UPI00226B3948|nr:phage tail tape measure protein [Erwinia psidii]MCX8962133.1 phage tail tape measure protein [Erwinia psidii]
MARDMALALQISAKDGASKVLKQIAQDTLRNDKTVKKSGDELARAQQQNGALSLKASRALQAEYRRAASARSALGIRSEQAVRREIQQTQAAYNRLTRAGVMSANEQARAFQAMTSRVSQLRGELTGAGLAVTRLQRLQNAGRNMMALAGGVTAAGAVLSRPVRQQMSYDRQLAYMANTGFNELGPAQRLQKKSELNQAIRRAVRNGGTPEQGAETLNSILAGGQVDSDTAMAILPDIMRYSTASGASPEDLAKIATAAIANFGITKEQLPALFDKAVRSGENGSFELNDMAAYLPKQMSMAKAIGMSGLADIDRLLAMNQANSLTAGDNSSAANNINNLMQKITSADTIRSMKNYRFRSAGGKPVNYTDYMVEQRRQGVSTPDAFMNAVTGIVSNNKQYQALKAKAAAAKGTAQEDDINAALDVLVSSITSKIIADAQAGMALKTNILQRAFIDEQIKGTQDAAGAGENAFQVIAAGADFKTEQLKSEKFFADNEAVKPLTEALGNTSRLLAEYASEYPGLTKAVAGATIGITAMTAAATAFAGLKFLTGGAAAAGAAGTGGAGAAVAGAARGGLLRRLGGRLLAPLALWQAAENAPLMHVERGDAAARDRIKAGGRRGMALMKDGLAAQPGLLDVWDEVKAWWSAPTSLPKTDFAGAGVPGFMMPQHNAPQPLQIISRLEIDGRVLAETVNNVNGTQADRGPTGVQP